MSAVASAGYLFGAVVIWLLFVFVGFLVVRFFWRLVFRKKQEKKNP